LKKSFGGGERNFLEPLMRFVRNDVKDHVVSQKTTTDFPLGAMQHPSGGLVKRSTFARFLEFFDFRLFQQYRPEPDIGAEKERACMLNSVLELSSVGLQV
jgi:hypothetical protein